MLLRRLLFLLIPSLSHKHHIKNHGVCVREIKFARFRILMITTCCVFPPGPLQHATNPSANNYRHKQEETDSETVPQDVRHAVLLNLAFPSRQFFSLHSSSLLCFPAVTGAIYTLGNGGRKVQFSYVL